MLHNNLHKSSYLVCVNTEEYSEVALHYACMMARKNNASVVLLYVIEPADYSSFGMVADKIRNEQHEEAQKLLNDLARKAKEWSGAMPVVIVREGVIEDQIIEAVTEYENINMLITGIATESAQKSRIIPPLVAALGTKLQIPMLIVPGNKSLYNLSSGSG
jgi:hypothetical protein